MAEARHPTIHQFLKWAPGAIGAGAVAVAAVWQGTRDWVAEMAAWGWHQMSSPWVAVFVIVGVCAYIWAIIYTGRPAKPPAPLLGVLDDHQPDDPRGSIDRLRVAARNRYDRALKRIAAAERASKNESALADWCGKVKSGSEDVLPKELGAQRADALKHLTPNQFKAYCAAIDETEELNHIKNLPEGGPFSQADISRKYIGRAKKALLALGSLIQELNESERDGD